jgi:hypothetical protein
MGNRSAQEADKMENYEKSMYIYICLMLDPQSYPLSVVAICPGGEAEEAQGKSEECEKRLRILTCLRKGSLLWQLMALILGQLLRLRLVVTQWHLARSPLILWPLMMFCLWQLRVQILRQLILWQLVVLILWQLVVSILWQLFLL